MSLFEIVIVPFCTLEVVGANVIVKFEVFPSAISNGVAVIDAIVKSPPSSAVDVILKVSSPKFSIVNTISDVEPHSTLPKLTSVPTSSV